MILVNFIPTYYYSFFFVLTQIKLARFSEHRLYILRGELKKQKSRLDCSATC